jgi:hypothetical protein
MWFVGLWCAGVAAVGGSAWLFRALLAAATGVG